jgi:hypothetical protein
LCAGGARWLHILNSVAGMPNTVIPMTTDTTSASQPSTSSLRHNTMRWRPWTDESTTSAPDQRRPVKWSTSLSATDWSHYSDPRTVVPTVLLTATILGSWAFYRSYLRRIPGASYVVPSAFRKRRLLGVVTRVGDGDNFHLFHTPGGRLAGWGWARKVPAYTSQHKRTVGSPTRGFTVCGQRLTCLCRSQFASRA